MTMAIPTKAEIQRRFIEIDATEAKQDTFQLSFSSETPVQRAFGEEVMDRHGKMLLKQ